MEQETNPAKESLSYKSSPVNDPQPTTPLMKITYVSVTGASIAIIIAILHYLLNCGCK
jgi:hypothetical protein